MHYLDRTFKLACSLATIADTVFIGGLIQTIYISEVKIPRRLKQKDNETWCPDVKYSTQELNQELAASVERLRRVEDHSRATLIGASLAAALIGPALSVFGPTGVVHATNPSVRSLIATLLVLASFFLITSGLLALRGYRVGVVYRPRLTDFGFPRIKAQIDSLTLHCIEQNDTILAQRTNYLKASFSCIRNGLILLFLFQLLVIAIAISS